MKRICLIVSYDGTNYVGWQMQPNGTAVEAVINTELSALLGENIVIAGASRTDSGVHAHGNVAVFDTETRIPAEKICYALNQRLPDDIVIQDSFYVADDFHPRHANCTKTYEYTIYNANHPDPLMRRYSYFVYVPLDVEAMKQAATYLVGEHDFASFCSAHAQTLTTVRTIYGIEISSEGSEEYRSAGVIRIRIWGNGFLYNMVRIIVGTLVRVGHHMYTPEHVKEILEACDRNTAGPKAPAAGLTLVGIEYDENEMLPKTEQ